jgi:hypothetical protein
VMKCLHSAQFKISIRFDFPEINDPLFHDRKVIDFIAHKDRVYFQCEQIIKKLKAVVFILKFDGA